jgi:hypothetical protein
MTPRGFVVYDGPSRLDGAPIFAAVTLESGNEKTGNIAQAWILRSDVAPNDAVRDGRDRSICGDCVHRSGTAYERSCYVIVWLAPLNVFKGYAAGAYPYDAAGAAVALAGEQLRVSAYGDPAAVPFDIWRALLAHVAGFTFYTHQWRTCDQRFRSVAMASVESEREAEYAHTLGWRTFRTRLVDEPLRSDEIVCPASEEAGHLVTCEACGLCRGAARGSARSVAIVAHGMRVRWLANQKHALSLRSLPS